MPNFMARPRRRRGLSGRSRAHDSSVTIPALGRLRGGDDGRARRIAGQGAAFVPGPHANGPVIGAAVPIRCALVVQQHVRHAIGDAPTVRIIEHILLEEERHLQWGQAIYEELATTPERRRAALEWQMELEDLLVRSGGVTGGR